MIDNFDKRINWIDTLGFIPSKCIERVDIVDGDKTLFHGCFDWHSAVHGYWALFRMDNCGSGRYHDKVRDISLRFTYDKVSSVISELKESPQFELPYGRAWLLKLIVEYEIWVKKYQINLPKIWRELGETTADSLFQYYQGDGLIRSPNILSNQYNNDCFSVVQLFNYYQHTNNQNKKAALGDYVCKFFVEEAPTINLELDKEPRAFFSPFWSWIYLLAKTQPDEKFLKLVKVSNISEDSLQPLPPQEISQRQVHHLGINWSRAWAIKSLARRLQDSNFNAEKIVESYKAHIEQGLEIHKKFAKEHPVIDEKEAYYSYYHWVPQFAIYAITD